MPRFEPTHGTCASCGVTADACRVAGVVLCSGCLARGWAGAIAPSGTYKAEIEAGRHLTAKVFEHLGENNQS